MIGYDFTVGATDITINALGVEDINNADPAGYGDGTYAATQAGVWNAAGTLLGSVTVLDGTKSPIADGFRYVKLSSPVTLQAGQSYTIGSQKGGSVDFFSDGSATANYVGNGVTLTADRYSSTAGFVRPTSDGGENNGRWSGGNATFITTGPTLLAHPNPGAERNDFSGTVGYEFTTGSTAVTIKALGMFDQNIDGLATSHQVGLWVGGDGPHTLLGSVTVASGTTDPLIGFYRYHDLATAVTLQPNQTYWVAAEIISGGDAWHNQGNPGLATFTTPTFSGYTFGDGVREAGVFRVGSFGVPTNRDTDTILNNIFGAPNLLAIPEPSTFLLAALSVLGLPAWGRRRRR